jgi:hypothetical protein
VTAKITKYTPIEQEKLLHAAWIQATHRLCALLVNRRSELIKLAQYRGLTLGVDAYGDESFFHSLDRLRHETMCELADGIWYQAIYDIKDKGLLSE